MPFIRVQKYPWRIQLSTELHEKLILIKSVEGLSNPEFAEKIEVSENTLKGIWKRGSTPKGDILEKVAAIWPEYAYWLLTGKENLPNHISPLSKNSDVRICRLVDVVRDVQSLDGPVRSEWFTEVVFLQVKEELSDLVALIKIKQENTFGPNHDSYILVSDDLNFVSNGGGQMKLKHFAWKLEELGRGDLIRTSSSRLISRNDMSELMMTYSLLSSSIKEMHITDDKLKQIHINFSKWRMEGHDYTPQTWNIY